MERNKRSYHVPCWVSVRLTVNIAANIKLNSIPPFFHNLTRSYMDMKMLITDE